MATRGNLNPVWRLKWHPTGWLDQISGYFGVYLLILPSPSQKSESEKNLVKKWKTSHKRIQSFAINVLTATGGRRSRVWVTKYKTTDSDAGFVSTVWRERADHDFITSSDGCSIKLLDMSRDVQTIDYRPSVKGEGLVSVCPAIPFISANTGQVTLHSLRVKSSAFYCRDFLFGAQYQRLFVGPTRFSPSALISINHGWPWPLCPGPTVTTTQIPIFAASRQGSH